MIITSQWVGTLSRKFPKWTNPSRNTTFKITSVKNLVTGKDLSRDLWMLDPFTHVRRVCPQGQGQRVGDRGRRVVVVGHQESPPERDELRAAARRLDSERRQPLRRLGSQRQPQRQPAERRPRGGGGGGAAHGGGRQRVLGQRRSSRDADRSRERPTVARTCRRQAEEGRPEGEGEGGPGGGGGGGGGGSGGRGRRRGRRGEGRTQEAEHLPAATAQLRAGDAGGAGGDDGQPRASVDTPPDWRGHAHSTGTRPLDWDMPTRMGHAHSTGTPPD